MTQNIQYILYLRKSTDDSTHQKLSLPTQDFDTRAYAANNGLNIFMSVTDSRTAKLPGRPGFDGMINKIEAGFPFPVGIIAWSVDRLSRNDIDEATIRRLLASGKLADIQFLNFRYEKNATGNFLLEIQFAQARYHINSHAEGLQRTIREKLRRGQYPGRSFFGYRYDHRIRNIAPRKKEASLILSFLERFSTGDYSLRTAVPVFKSMCRESRIKRTPSVSSVNWLLRNPAYAGLFRWKGKIHEGQYKPIIPMPLFKRVQSILDGNKRTKKLRTTHNFPYCGIFRCPCGGMITAQYAKGGRYTYYRCSKKLGTPCAERYVRSEELRKQLIKLLDPIALPQGWFDPMQDELVRLRTQQKQTVSTRERTLQRNLDANQRRVLKLLELNLDDKIDDDVFEAQQEVLLKQKAELKSAFRELNSETPVSWLEPLSKAINTMKAAAELDSRTSDVQLAEIVKRVGTNHRISDGLARFEVVAPYDSAASVLACFAGGPEDLQLVAEPQKLKRPTWCALLNAVRTRVEELREPQGDVRFGVSHPPET
jgi:DNA invertase Pin-like site-specific DNA recombinase